MLRLLIMFLLSANICSGQKWSANYDAIDWEMRKTDAPTVDSLAKKISVSFQSDIEKTRAIFSWIAQHIGYNTGIYNAGKGYRPVKFFLDPDDTVSSKSAVEQTAERVFKRRIAVCDGYAKLFKTLCDYTGVEC